MSEKISVTCSANYKNDFLLAMFIQLDLIVSLWCAEYTKGWYLCQLEVLECKKVPWPNAATVKNYGIEDCGWSSKEFAYECKISLLTGRTHQVSTIFIFLYVGKLFPHAEFGLRDCIRRGKRMKCKCILWSFWTTPWI